MPVRLTSINCGKARRLNTGRREIITGIFKEPVAAPVAVGPLGLEGDLVANTKHHGGPDQAVYIYTEDDYEWWAQAHGVATAPGLFGENLTISGFESAGQKAGDRLTIGAVVLEVTAPRIPCATFAAKMGDPGLAKRFRKARRPGLYARVIVPGTLTAGDAVILTPTTLEGPDLGAQFDLYFEPRPSRAAVEAVLALPIAERERAHYEQML